MTEGTGTLESGMVPVRELSLDDALALAKRCHQTGELADAEVLYGRILDADPENADAHHFLGLLLHQQGRPDEAAAHLQRSIALAPDAPELLSNLGNVLIQRERYEEAITAYQRALTLAPNDARTHSNLGVALRANGEAAAAETAFRRALALDETLVNVHTHLGELLTAEGRIAEATSSHLRAMTYLPQGRRTRHLHAIAHSMLGELGKAREVILEWLQEEPGNPVAQHMLASCGGAEVPGRAPDIYVEQVFDDFSASFDARLRDLDYDAPNLVAAALRRALGRGAAALDLLDAGCGTGLCGPLLRPFARPGGLVGVDLSAKMLERASARSEGGPALYDRLEKAELTAYLAAASAAYDAIVSADTLVYFGALEEVLAGAAGALRRGGTLIFTVERHDGEGDHRLQVHGRYSHARAYVERCLASAGLDVVDLEVAVLRQEKGEPVQGFVVTARRP